MAIQLGLPAGRQQVWRRRRPQPGRCVDARVLACGACRTDLHLADGDLPLPGHPVVPGHEIVGRIEALGEGVAGLGVGDRRRALAGLDLRRVRARRAGRENLCEHARFTGWQIAGGWQGPRRRRCALRIPPARALMATRQAALLLCAGLIGWRAYTMAGDAQRLACTVSARRRT